MEYGNVYAFVRVLGDERIFSLSCFDLEDGSLVWSTPMSGTSQNMSFYSAPAVGDGKVLIVREGTEAVHLTAYDAMTGEGVWNYELSPTYKHYLSPVIVDDAVYMAQGPFERDGEVVTHCTVIRLDLATGEEVWTRTLDEPAASHAAYANDMLFVTRIHMYDGRTYISALDADTGNVVWSENIANEAYDMSCPVIIDGNVYVAVGANNAEYSYITRIICYDAETGDHIWATTQDDSYHVGWHVFAAGGDFVIPTVMSEETTFTAYDAATGDVTWSHTFGDVIEGTSSTDDTIVCTWTSNPFAGTEDYDMHIGLFDIATRRFVETYTESMPGSDYWVSSWMPALAGDSIVVCLGAKLMCYN